MTIANDWADLTDGSLDVALSVTELNRPVTGSEFAWTGTRFDGTSEATGDPYCQDWTDGTGTFIKLVGQADQANSQWTQWGYWPCDALRRLYCFQQR